MTQHDGSHPLATLTRLMERRRAAACPARPLPGAIDWPALAVITILLVPLAIWDAGVNLLLAALVGWTLLGPARAVQAMALGVVIKFVNPGLVETGTAAAALLWLILLVAGLRVLPALRRVHLRQLGLIWLFALIAALLSAAASVDVRVSVLKAITFAWVISTLLVAVQSLDGDRLLRLARWFAALGLFVITASALTLLEPAVAYRLNGTGLQGIFSHPQTLAIVVAPLAAACMLATLLGRKLRPLLVALSILLVAILLLTEARTGLLAGVAGLAGGLALHLWRGSDGRGGAGRLRIVAVIVAGCVGLAVFAATQDDLTQQAESFLLKRSESSDLGEAFYRSRGAGIAGQWHNFLARPLTGNGFGVYAANSRPMEVIDYMGIPISAPVEKGFLPTAVLEETGVIGGTVLLLALLGLTRRAWQSGDARWFGLFVAAVATNVGEASMLSPGGPGLLLWCYIALAINAQAIPAQSRRDVGASAVHGPVSFPNLMR